MRRCEDPRRQAARRSERVITERPAISSTTRPRALSTRRALDGRQRHPHQLDEARVGGPTVTAGAVIGVVGHAACHGDHGVGVDVVCAAEVPAFGEGAANLDVDPVRRAPPRRQACRRSGRRRDAGRDATGGRFESSR